jgi:BON domain-containing protein
MSERPDYLPEHIREQLIHDLRVEVQEKKVMLGGNVSSPQIRERITEVVKEIVPGYEIVNETNVVSGSEPEGEERVS